MTRRDSRPYRAKVILRTMEPSFQVLPPGSKLPPTKPPRRGGVWGVLAAAGVAAFKFITPLLVFIKTAGTMLLSVGGFMLMGWTWQVAAGLVVLIFVHEMGHFISAKLYGIPVSAPMFIPFVGAYVLLKKGKLDAWTDAVISYAGPLAGALGAWACYGLGLTLGWPWLFSVAFYTFIFNLFNLLPIPPMDGSYIWITFSRTWTPNMILSDRLYMGLFLAALIAGMLLGCLVCWPYLHPVE